MASTIPSSNRNPFHTLLKVAGALLALLTLLWMLPSSSAPFGSVEHALIRAFWQHGQLPDGLPGMILVLLTWI